MLWHSPLRFCRSTTSVSCLKLAGDAKWVIKMLRLVRLLVDELNNTGFYEEVSFEDFASKIYRFKMVTD